VSASASEYSVAVVVDRAFGERLAALARRLHVWACATAENQRAATGYWAGQRSSPEAGITTFKVSDSDSPERMLIRVMPDVELHHGKYAHTPPWQALEVYGVAATVPIRKALSELGVREFTDTSDGFVCRRETTGS
jgi:hypothetical protein